MQTAYGHSQAKEITRTGRPWSMTKQLVRPVLPHHTNSRFYGAALLAFALVAHTSPCSRRTLLSRPACSTCLCSCWDTCVAHDTPPWPSNTPKWATLEVSDGSRTGSSVTPRSLSMLMFCMNQDGSVLYAVGWRRGDRQWATSDDELHVRGPIPVCTMRGQPLRCAGVTRCREGLTHLHVAACCSSGGLPSMRMTDTSSSVVRHPLSSLYAAHSGVMPEAADMVLVPPPAPPAAKAVAAVAGGLTGGRDPLAARDTPGAAPSWGGSAPSARVVAC